MKYLAILCLCCLIGCTNSRKIRVETIPVSDAKILKSYSENHLVAKHSYENKIIRVYGTVTKVTELNDGTTRIKLNNMRFISSFSFRIKELVIDFSSNQVERINQAYEKTNIANYRRSATQTKYLRNHPSARFTKIGDGIRVNDYIFVEGFLVKDNKTLILKPSGKYKLRNRNGIQRWDRRAEVFIGEIE